MAIEGILVSKILEILKNLVIPVVAQRVGFSWSLKDDLKKLQDNLEIIHAKIADAEEKKEKSNELRVWLKRLKDVAYDADDVMDDFSYETMRQSERESLKNKTQDFFSSSNNPLAYRCELTKNIKEINNRVDHIAKDMERFQLQTTFNNTVIAHGESSEQRSRQTASVIIDSEIVGREDDKNKLVDILKKATTSSSSSVVNQSLEKVSIISVVGMGGLGKTTLAQLVYNDKLVVKHFDQRIWVCVSTDFDVENVFIKIMESTTLAKFYSGSSLELLVKKVQEKLQGKKFLLVLDDLWNENVLQWERLKNPLLVGAQGSTILITTRNMQVADAVKGSIRPYQLQKLQEDECWSIMEKKAFSPGGAIKTPNMTNIGKEIANKCSGLPLAAKFLGSLMHSKNKESDWLSIRETSIWNTREGQSEILPILKLSYDNLSPHLKQCFSYCSIFPKGWVIKKETLIHMWMAEGFLEPLSNVGNERMVEEIGEEYFDSLVWSSFLDDVEKNDLDDIITCKMHDLVHDLGRDVVGNRECAIVKTSELGDSSDIRRLQLISDAHLSTRCAKALSESKKLRTIIVLEPNDNMNGYAFSSNKKLRAIHFGRIAEGCPDFARPEANKLRHVRYVHLPDSNLNGVIHDDSISKLYNLQTLALSGSSYVQKLLESMGSWKNLRFLDISFSDIKELPDSVTSLRNLQRLNLSHCECLTTFPNSVTGMQNLKDLDLSSTPIEELPGFIINHLRNLQTLDLNSCKKLKSLPEYVGVLAKLRIFNIKSCLLLEALPKDFGSLYQLRSLDLKGTAIRVLPESCSNLHNLEVLNLSWCELPKEVNNWIKLRTFYYNNMETPRGIGKLVFLQKLIYRVREKVIDKPGCIDGIEELGNLNFLQTLSIVHLQNVKDPIDAERVNLKGKQNLRELELCWNTDVNKQGGEIYFPSVETEEDYFQVFEVLQPPTGLKTLCIRNFMGWELPTWMCVPSGLPNLEMLRLIHCKETKQLPASIGQLPRLRCLDLEGMSLKSLDIGGFPSLLELNLINMFLLEELCYSYPCLQDLWICDCNCLTEIPLFPCLTKLELMKIDNKLVCSLGRSQTSLTDLRLMNIDELIDFPVSILQNNRNLQRLDFIDCPDLKFLPDLRGWTSLQTLHIRDCPQVKESLTYDLKSLSFLQYLWVDFIQRDEKRGDPSPGEDLVNLMKN